LINVIDVTEAPYYADNTGNVDCTGILRRVFDDLLYREVKGVKETEQKLHTLGKNDVYIGFETRIEKNLTRVIFPEFVPDARIIYFPDGVYLVSDTVTYTRDDVKNIFDSKPGFELTRGIHITGESRKGTVIRLKDNCEGFGKGANKPVISYINAEGCMEKETSNVSQLNTLTDLTVDCGAGNAGAVGVRFIANNSGRIENVTVKSEGSDTGIGLACGCEGVFRNIDISGFDTGIYSVKSSVCAVENVNFSDVSGAAVQTGGSSVVLRNIKSENGGKYAFLEGYGNYVLFEDEPVSDRKENTVYNIASEPPRSGIPVCDADADSYAAVEDFGAVGDGKTDCTAAIQEALDSGKETIYFTGGHYFVNGKITVPETVKKIDFMFCDFFAGEKLISGETDALFIIEGESESPLLFEHLYTFEQFYGHFRLICHAARRDLILKDIHTQTAATYFNTVGGSNVYLDNCAATVGTYSNDCIIGRKGYKPEYCHMIPFEFHGQKVTAWNLNPERADTEVLNDNSELVCYGFKVEGPGTAIKTVNGGKTEVYVFSCGIGDITAKNALFENKKSSVLLLVGKVFGVCDTLDYNLILESDYGGKTKRIYKKDLPTVTGYRVNFSLFEQ
ncbi:MAG: hypothetical protein J6T73_04190, partial [Clostridia bacterium]|nr:hypothetical protein [Clostridia bacterium]